jgi:hypothetical protein
MNISNAQAESRKVGKDRLVIKICSYFFSAQWFNALGAYYFRNNDLRQSLHYVQLAVTLTTSLTYPTREAMVASQSAVMLLDILGDPVAAKIHAQRAQAFAELLGDVCGRVQSICYEIRLCCSVGNFQHAAKLFAEIDALVPAAGATRSLVLQTVEEVRIDFHIQKTEYPEALKMVLASLHSKETARPSVRDTALDHINVAFMSNMTGAQREVVASHLDAVRAQCTTFVNWPCGLQSCETHAGCLDIREGNVAAARPILEKTFKYFFESQDRDNIGLCLEQLADHTYGMYNLDTTLHWVCVYLACGLGTSNTWTTIHALRCMGTLFSACGDHETALSVFQVALDGFTLMDVHMGKGKCMAGMAEILERKGEIARAKELWSASRPMFERSGQARSVAQVDASLCRIRAKILI